MSITEPKSAQQSSRWPSEKKPRVRLEYLDGLRGLAALYVVFNHTSILSMILLNDDSNHGSLIVRALHYLHYCVLNYGVYAVCFFIVLSGYCLMLPIVQSPDETLRGGIGEFIIRRARRICPPYFAALTLCLLLEGFGPKLHIDTDAMNWHNLVNPVFTVGDIISHVLLMHCWTPWISKIDPPMWSVSVEWNIYFIFALILLPIFKKLGSATAIAFGLVLGLVPHFLFHGSLDRAHPWMLGLFAFGMFGAVVNFSPRSSAQTALEHVPWGLLTGVFASLLTLLTAVHERASFRAQGHLHWLKPQLLDGPYLEVLAGLLAMSTIIYCTQITVKTNALPAIFRLLESPATVRLGAFSYSLYLIHNPIIELVWLWARESRMSPLTGSLIMYAVAVPLALIFSYGFHLAFERPFLPGHYRKVLHMAA